MDNATRHADQRTRLKSTFCSAGPPGQENGKKTYWKHIKHVLETHTKRPPSTRTSKGIHDGNAALQVCRGSGLSVIIPIGRPPRDQQSNSGMKCRFASPSDGSCCGNHGKGKRIENGVRFCFRFQGRSNVLKTVRKYTVKNGTQY